MFVDKVRVSIKAGDGGNGAVSFRHEKFIDRGGPDGGDGGNGGSVVLQASRNQDTLATFRYKKELKGESGSPGSKRKKHGKSGHELVVAVPVGTQVLDGQGLVVADLTTDGQRAEIAKGGKGGYGNAHFVSSRRQAPRIAEKGELGEHLSVSLELKLIADVGIVGLPNAGKSTLLAHVSHAQPEIADYPFTTLNPNLGVVDIDKKTSLLLADIPGLIEGASKGKGLGDEFLRHIERTSVLIHLIDFYTEATKAYKTIQKELKSYKIDLTKKPQFVVINKIDGVTKAELDLSIKKLKKLVPKGTSLYAVSAKSGTGLKKLFYDLYTVVQKQRTPKVPSAKKSIPILRLPESDNSWQVNKEGNTFVISGKKIERFASRTDFTNPEGVERLRVIMRKMGIEHDLLRKGIKSKDKIVITEKENTQNHYTLTF